jgi:hypothetical protein
MERKVITKEESIAPKANQSTWYIDTNLPPVGAWELAVLDWRNRADITIVIAAAAIATIISGTIVAGGAVITVDSVVGVSAVVSIVVFIGWPDTQETSCHRVFLSRLIIILLFRGGVMPFPGHIIVVVFIFQFPVEKELEVLAVCQRLVVLWPGPEVPLLCVPVQRSAGLIGGLGVKLRGHLPAGHCRRRVSRMVQLLSAWGRRWMHGASIRD